MTKIEVELHEDVVSVLNKLKNINDTGIELSVPEGAVLFENILNIKLIKKWSEKESRVVNFETNDERGQNMLLSLEEQVFKADSPEEMDYEEEEAENSYSEVVEKKVQKGNYRKVPFLTFLSKKKNIGIFVALLLILGLGGIFLYKFVSTQPVAYIKVVVNSQPLTKSLSIRVKNDSLTNAEQKTLKGYMIEAYVDDSLKIPTTGEKTIGEKAQGSITIINKTSENKKIKKGTTLTYENNDQLYEYITLKEIEVEGKTETVGLEGSGDVVVVWGREEVDVEAKEIGDKYNLEKAKKLKFDDYKTSEMEAEVEEKIDGGKEEKIKIVAQEDIDELKTKLSENSNEKAIRALETKVGNGIKLINGSTMVSVFKESFSQALDEEAEEITLEQTFVAKGLTYEQEELNNLVDKLVEGFIPENYVLSTKERAVNVEVLGNTDKTVLSETEADIQVTLKTYVVTDISEEKVINDLMGKKAPEAERYLGGIRNVKTYELNIAPKFPFFDYIPYDENRIEVVLERE